MRQRVEAGRVGVLTAAGLLTALCGLAIAQPASPMPQQPALSPDGDTIAFVWAGDVWAMPSAGGAAKRLTAHPALDTTPRFNAEGTMLAFESDRDGATNLYVMELGPGLVAGQPRRVTVSDRSQSLGGFSADGSSLIFSARMDPSIYRHARMYSAPLDGGPVEMLTPAFGKEVTQASNGDLVFTRGYGIANRPNYRGSGSMDLWRLDADTGNFVQLTEFAGNDMTAFQRDDGSVVFVSSRSGQNNVHLIAPEATGSQPGAITQLTDFQVADGQASIGHGVRDLAVSADGSMAAFVVWDTLYTLSLDEPGALPQAVRVSAAADDSVAETDRINISRDASEAVLHPSGDAIALVLRGEIYIRSTEEDRPARRVTNTHARERHIAWSPDGQRLYFSVDDEESLGSIHAASVVLSKEDLVPPSKEDEVKDEEEAGGDDEQATDEQAEDVADGAGEEPANDEKGDDEAKAEKKDTPDFGARWADALTFSIEPVIVGSTWDRRPRPSPDGKSLLIVRGLGDLVLHDLGSGDQRVVLESWDEPEVFWASDSAHLVYAVSDLDFNNDIWILDTTLDEQGNAREAVNITRHPDIDTSPRLSHDGKVLTFLSDRDNQNWDYDVYAVFLDSELEGKRAYELDEYFSEAAKAAKKLKPLEPSSDDDDAGDSQAKKLDFDTEDAYLRVRRLTTLPGSEGDLAMTPGGERIIFEASVDGDTALYSVDHRGDERKTIETGGVSDVSVSISGEDVIYIDGGTAKSASPTGSSKETYGVSEDIVIEIAEQQRQKFMEGARTFGEYFYHPTMKGLDWPALVERYAELAEQTRTSAEFNAVFTLLLGEVDGSHTGIRGGGGFSAGSPGTGYLGVDVSPAGDGYRVEDVLAKGPADLGETGLQAGDVLIAVNETPLLQNGVLTDFGAAMVGTAGEETLFEVRGEDGQQRFVLLSPHSFGSENNLRYTHEVLDRRAEVERLSNGRLGYLHIRGMNLPSVRDFERDLYAAAAGKEGLVIDVRDNGGGFTTDILLASLTAPNHAYTIPRGADPASVPTDAYPRDRRLIYGWSRPINVLVNQHSFSNAEIFAHAIKTIGRGTIIGTPTFGGVISTGSFSLIDGTTIRRPFRGWWTADGKDMDIFPAVPDINVPQKPADEARGVDPQLEAAVNELLGRVGS